MLPFLLSRLSMCSLVSMLSPWSLTSCSNGCSGCGRRRRTGSSGHTVAALKGQLAHPAGQSAVAAEIDNSRPRTYTLSMLTIRLASLLSFFLGIPPCRCRQQSLRTRGTQVGVGKNGKGAYYLLV